MIRERQMRLHGHVARFPASDPARRILSLREPTGRTRPVGRPHDTWLRQMDRYFAEMGMGRVAAWRMAIRIQETEGVPLEGRCSNTLPRRMLPLTD